MGEMCDFEAEYYPQNWGPSYRKSGKTRTKKVITIRMNQQEHAAYKAIGGAVAARKCIVRAAAALAEEAKP